MMIYITITGPQSSVDLEIDANRRIGELIEQLLDIFKVRAMGNSNEWGLGMQNGSPFSKEKTLEECSVTDGAYLKLQNVHAWNSGKEVSIHDISPTIATGGMGIRFKRDE
jgi:uncharacterized ubiquitin-like protein YukD